MLIAGMDINDMSKGANISTYLGSGSNIYVSSDNLYSSVTKYNYDYQQDGISTFLAGPQYSYSTSVYKFALNDGNPAFTAKGEVPGTILNQFSMDEYNGYFRIATTKGNTWSTGSDTSKNNVYVLDDKLNVTGKIEDMAPGEKIYATRFVGDRAYVVTFRTVDPLFVIDLKDPSNPNILGKLKIPGYSDYIEPYDENHIIGFGKDAAVTGLKDQNGNVIGNNAYYLGMKIAMFDVTDPANPVQQFSTAIGDRGTYSDVLSNHKALLFSRDKNLLALPVTVMQVSNTSDSDYNGVPQYGTFAFQGAYVYNIDTKSGFTLKGKITHISDDEYKKAGDYWYDGSKSVERILYINDMLYTLSQGMIKANSMSNLKEISSVTLP
jgi:uncharacterized secreted protein with C-terminal beta-propeller domain